MNPVRETRETLKQHFPHLSAKTATRIVALSTFSIGFTEIFLELCHPESKEEAFLLDSSLKQSFSHLDPIRALIQKHQLREVVVIQNQQEFVIGLEDELLAEAGEKKLLAEPPLESLFSVTVGTTSIALNFLPEKPFFETREIQEIFKVLATSVNASQKIEALNKMMLLPLEPTSKTTVLMKLLEDAHQEVLQSVFTHLSHFGLHPEISEIYGLLQKETVWQTRAELIRRLGHFKSLNEADQEVIRKLLWSLLASENQPPCLCAILETLSLCKETPIQEVSRFIPRILAKLVEHLPFESPNGHPHRSPHLFSLVEALRNLFATWRTSVGAELLAVGIEELSKQNHPFLRALFSEVLSELALYLSSEAVPDLVSKKERLATLIVACVVEENSSRSSTILDEFDPRNTLLVAGLKNLRNFAIPPLIRAFSEIQMNRRRLFLRILNEIVWKTVLVASEQRVLLQFYIEYYRDFDGPQRQIVMESSVFDSSETDLLEQFTEKMLYRLEILETEALASVGLGLRRIGGPAMPSLFKQLKDTTRVVLQEKLLFLLGDLFLSAHFKENHRPFFQKIVEWLLRFFEEASAGLKGEIALTLGKATRCPIAESAQVEVIARDLMNEIHQITNYDRRTHYKLLDGVAYLSGSRFLNTPELRNLSQFFLKILSQPMPENLMKQTGDRYEFQDGTQVYTEVIPRIVFGLGEILNQENLAPALTSSILIRLINRFRDIVAYRVIWAPSNIIQIAKVLVKFGENPLTSLTHKQQIVETLLKHLENKQILVLLTDLVSANPQPDFDLYTKTVLEGTLDALETQAQEEPHIEDRILLLNNLMTLLKRDKGEVNLLLDPYLDRILEILSDGVREKVPGLYDHLRKLFLSEKTSQKIRTRLQRMIETGDLF